MADYFVNPAFRRELLRVLNRGEATNALKRLIYTGRVASYQAKSEDEMQAVADALSLLANIVMAWNTHRLQIAIDRVPGEYPDEVLSRIAPIGYKHINLRGIMTFDLSQLGPSLLGRPPDAVQKRASS